MIKIICSEYSSSLSHFVFPINTTEYLVSDRAGNLRSLLINHNPTNDDEKFWSILLGTINIDGRINTIIPESIRVDEQVGFKIFTCGLTTGEILEIR